jgi:hypothetical protein
LVCSLLRCQQCLLSMRNIPLVMVRAASTEPSCRV